MELFHNKLICEINIKTKNTILIVKPLNGQFFIVPL